MNTVVIESENKQKEMLLIGKAVFIICLTWLLAIVVTALSGGFDASAGERPLAILFAVLMPVAVFAVSYLNIESFREWVLALDMRQLILLHSWRMVGMGFVFLYFQDLLPALFALPAGIGDGMTAVGALFLGVAMYERAGEVSIKRVFLWNTFGLVDFVIAVSMGILTRTGEVLNFSGQAGSEITGVFPLALIPGFAVPFYVITHLIIYAQLKVKLKGTTKGVRSI
jgi:hypothetical protein